MSTRAIRPELVVLLSALFLAAPPASAETNAKVGSAASLAIASPVGATFAVDGAAIVVTKGAKHVRLHPIAAAVLALADGKSSIESIRKGVEELSGYAIDDATVFAALDGLADAGLLAARVTPPGGSSDPELVVVVDGTPGTELVRAASEGPSSGEWSKAIASEQKTKRARRDEVQKESATKAKASDVAAAESKRKAAMKELDAARAKESDAKAGKKLSESAQKASTKELAAKKLAAEESAKAEAKLRKVRVEKETASEMAAKKKEKL